MKGLNNACKNFETLEQYFRICIWILYQYHPVCDIKYFPRHIAADLLQFLLAHFYRLVLFRFLVEPYARNKQQKIWKYEKLNFKMEHIS